MDTSNLFTIALNLQDPWEVSKVEFKPSPKQPDNMELHIWLSYSKGSTFPCPVSGCQASCPEHDHAERTWRHLDFFQYKAFLHANLPRVKCKTHGAKTVAVPWARTGSGFTLLFESLVVELAKHLPVDTIAHMVDEHDTRLWRLIGLYTKEARKREDYSGVTNIGMDETSIKGHDYITVTADLDKRKVIHVTEGKDATTVSRFTADFKEHGGTPEHIKVVTCDMALGFLAGIKNNFPNSQTVIDKFHVIKHINEAVDKVRKEEAKENTLLKKTKYLWLSNDRRLSDKQRAKKDSLMKMHLKTARAYAMRVALQDIYETCLTRSEAEERLSRLCSWMMHSRLAQMKSVCKMIMEHWKEILSYFDNRYTNAILEGMNCIIQNVKCRARGFRNVEYFKTMIYLACGKLDFDAVLGGNASALAKA